jgi:hypothetical protein
MKYKAKKWRRSLGIIYIIMEDNKRAMNGFIGDFLKTYDPALLDVYSQRKFDFKKRKAGKAFFIEGKELTMVILDEHIFIHAVHEDGVIDIVRELIEVSK